MSIGRGPVVGMGVLTAALVLASGVVAPPIAAAAPAAPTLRVLCLPSNGAPRQVDAAAACSGTGRSITLSVEQARILALGEGKALCVATRSTQVRTVSARQSCGRGERKVMLYRSLMMSGTPETQVMFAAPGDFGTFRVDTTASTATVTLGDAATGGSPITGYEYRLSSDGARSWSDWIARDASPFTITGLGPCTYAIEARGVNAVGAGATNGPVEFALKQPGACTSTGGSASGGSPIPMPRAAAAPTNLTTSAVLAANGSVTATITFTAPTDTGTADITGYQYQLSSNAGESFGPWSPAPATTQSVPPTSFTLTGLMAGAPYDIRVRAVTSVGSGAASAEAAFTAAAPGKPTITSVTRAASPWGSSYRSAGFGFSYPGGTGSSAIDEVEVTIAGSTTLIYNGLNSFNYSCNAGFTSCTDLYAPATIDGPHQVTVRAHNAAGWSPTSDAWLLYGAPSAPSITATVVGMDSISATVSAPTSTGSPVSTGASALITEEFALSRDGGSTWTTATPTGPSSPFTFTGLTSGTSYQLRVRATNAGGLSSDWTTTSFTTLAQPADVTGVTATYDAGTGKVNVAWSPATNAVSYAVRIATSAYDATTPGSYGPAIAVSGTSYAITATLGTKYWVQVQSINGVNSSPWTTAVSASALTSLAAPTITGITRNGGVLYNVQWSVPSTGGYRLTTASTACRSGWSSAGASGVAISGTSGSTVIGYCNDKPNVTVTINTASGPSASASYTLAGPDAPTDIASSVNGTTATITYSAPPAGLLGISGYQYQFRTNGGAWSAPIAVSGALTLTGLTSGQSYDVQVRAINWFAAGGWSATTSFTVGTVPAQVTGLAVDSEAAGASAVTVSFTPLPMSSMILRYEYRMRASGASAWGSAASGGSSSPITISGLTAGMSVDVQVRGVNAIGSGDWSDTLTVTPGAQPGAPTATLGASTGTSRSVTITAGTVPAGATIATYGLARDDDSSYAASSSATFTVTLPAAGTSVVLRPYVETTAGVRSMYGDPVTLGGAVSAPSAPSIAVSFDGQASTVSWTVSPSASTGGADLTGYQVEFSDGTMTSTMSGSAGAWSGSAMWNSTGNVSARSRTTNDYGMHWSGWSSPATVSIPMVTVTCTPAPEANGSCVTSTMPDAMDQAMMQAMLDMDPAAMSDCVKQADGTMACPMNAAMVAMMNDMVVGDMPLVSNVMMMDAGVMVGPDAIITKMTATVPAPTT